MFVKVLHGGNCGAEEILKRERKKRD